MKYLLLIILIAGAFWFYQQSGGSRQITVKKQDLSPRVAKIVADAKENPDKKDLQQLNAEFFSEQDPEVKAFLVRLISLGFLATDANAFRRFKITLEKKYPNEGYFDFLDNEFPAVCGTCDGDGGNPCSKCKGEGKCTNVKCENGKIKYESFDDKIEIRECFICKGQGVCKVCAGTGVSDISCKTCGGSGRKGSKSIAARLYKETLKSMK